MFSYVMALLPGAAKTRRSQCTVVTTRGSSISSSISFRTASETSAAVKAGEATGRPPAHPLHNNDLESQATSTTMVNRTINSATTKHPLPFTTRLRTWLRPSERTTSTAILCISEGIMVPFAVMASLAGVSNTRLVMLAGIAEFIAGAISISAGGILGAISNEERHQTEIRCTTKQVQKDPERVSGYLTTSLAGDLPTSIISDIIRHCQTLPTREKVALIMRFHQDPDPCPSDTYKAGATFFLTSFSGMPALIPYIMVQEDQVNLALHISIGIMTVLSFAYGWAKAGYNVGWTGLGNVARCLWGGLTFFGVVAVAAVLSVVIIRGIDHNL